MAAKYYLYEYIEGWESEEPLQASSRSEAREEVRAMWSDMPKADRRRRSYYLPVEVSEDYDGNRWTNWEGPNLAGSVWLVTAFDWPADGIPWNIQKTYCDTYDEAMDCVDSDDCHEWFEVNVADDWGRYQLCCSFHRVEDFLFPEEVTVI